MYDQRSIIHSVGWSVGHLPRNRGPVTHLALHQNSISIFKTLNPRALLIHSHYGWPSKPHNIMKDRITEPKPLAKVDLHNLEYYVLDEDDLMAWNSSTNYDHRMKGPSLVRKGTDPNFGTELQEFYVNDPDAWEYIDAMMQLGAKHLEENPDFNFRDWRKKIREAREDYEPHVSMHKKKRIKYIK